MFLQWHPQVHRKWANERLYFWRLGFFPTYDHRQVREGLLAALAAHNISSYTCYELIGAYDLLLRAWIPDSEDHSDVEESLIKHLSRANLRLCDRFDVLRTVRHWVWGDGCELKMPEAELLEQRPRDADLERIQQSPEDNQDLIQKMMDRKLLGDAEHSPGLKFFLVVTSSSPTTSLPVLRDLETRLISTLDDAPDGISERSLYSGSGFGRFLIMGRIPFDQFNLLGKYFVKNMNNQHLREEFVARTYTHLAAFDQPLIRADTIPLLDHEAEAAPQPSVEELLAGEESSTLEVKGSAFLDLKRLIIGDHTPNWDNQRVVDEVLKTITAFLNCEGGTLVIGALEANRFNSGDVADQLGDVPLVGDYFYVGTSVDYTERNWDAFQKRLEQIIESRITPDPTPFFRVAKRIARDRDMCVITVGEANKWFYLYDSQFYARRGNRSHLLTGPEAEEHRNARPRS